MRYPVPNTLTDPIVTAGADEHGEIEGQVYEVLGFDLDTGPNGALLWLVVDEYEILYVVQQTVAPMDEGPWWKIVKRFPPTVIESMNTDELRVAWLTGKI